MSHASCHKRKNKWLSEFNDSTLTSNLCTIKVEIFWYWMFILLFLRPEIKFFFIYKFQNASPRSRWNAFFDRHVRRFPYDRVCYRYVLRFTKLSFGTWVKRNRGVSLSEHINSINFFCNYYQYSRSTQHSQRRDCCLRSRRLFWAGGGFRWKYCATRQYCAKRKYPPKVWELESGGGSNRVQHCSF